MEKKIQFLVIIVISILCALALVLGLVFGLRKENDDDSNETGVLNSYDNTEELKKKYPTKNPTKIINYLENNIQNRLLTGKIGIVDLKHGKLGVIFFIQMSQYITYMEPDYH